MAKSKNKANRIHRPPKIQIDLPEDPFLAARVAVANCVCAADNLQSLARIWITSNGSRGKFVEHCLQLAINKLGTWLEITEPIVGKMESEFMSVAAARQGRGGPMLLTQAGQTQSTAHWLGYVIAMRLYEAARVGAGVLDENTKALASIEPARFELICNLILKYEPINRDKLIGWVEMESTQAIENENKKKTDPNSHDHAGATGGVDDLKTIAPSVRTKPMSLKQAARFMGYGKSRDAAERLRSTINAGAVRCQKLTRQSYVFDRNDLFCLS